MVSIAPILSRIDLSESIQLVRELAVLGVAAVNVSGGSPYYNPHIQRPAAFPPSDGYQPPEDPLVGVARQIHGTRGSIKAAMPEMPVVGTGYSYLQEYLPHVAQGVVAPAGPTWLGWDAWCSAIPSFQPTSSRRDNSPQAAFVRTFSDCTTAPRHGLVSGCFPLDAHYKNLPEAAQLGEIKAEKKAK